MAANLIRQLKQATKGLLYPSESDEPLEVVHWKTDAGRLTEKDLFTHFAVFTALSMSLLSGGFGLTLPSRGLGRLAPALGLVSLAFGVWYALGAQSLLPYAF